MGHSGNQNDGNFRTARVGGDANDVPTIFFEPTETTKDNQSPFYKPPTLCNQRVHRIQKWTVVACFLIGGAVGYFLGLKHQPTTSQPGLLKNGTSSSPASLPQVGLVELRGGSFTMGDKMDGLKDARPHQVSLAPFMMAKYEVTLELWNNVMLWGRDHGYPDLPAGNGKALNHPVYGISWGGCCEMVQRAE